MDKFIIIVDNHKSALATVAQQRQKFHDSEIVYASDFQSPTKLLNYINDLACKKIVFAWRGALREALMSSTSTSIYKNMLASKTVHLLIPDLVGLQPQNQKSELSLINSAHGYWVTSEELLHGYKKLFPEKIPLGIYHDLPDIEMIMKIRNQNLKDGKVIWVGNSKWGSNFGFVDHKGFNEIVKPLSRRLSIGEKFRIVDSANTRIKNSEVLDAISRSCFLIQTSVHEGTGLPLLEALGVGTVPITSKVGIAQEVLTGKLTNLIVERNVESFYLKLQELEKAGEDLSKSCCDAFDKYISKVQNEKLKWERGDIVFASDRSRLIDAFKLRFKWLIRHLRESRS